MTEGIMAKEIKKVVPIPSGVTVTMKGNVMSVSGPKGSNERNLWYPGINIEVADSRSSSTQTYRKKAQRAMIGTFASHITNLITGVLNWL